MEILRFANVRKDYGHRLVLRDVSFRINAGQKAGLIGANGAGKTSIIRLITGEEPASGGVITRAPRLRVGYVPQHVEDTGDMTAMQRLLAENTAAHDALRAAEIRARRGIERRAGRGDGVVRRGARRPTSAPAATRFPSRAAGMLDALGLGGRARDAGARALRRREERAVAGGRAARRAGAARPRRAGQPPGLRRHRLARGLSREVRGRGAHRLAQPLPARPRRRHDLRARGWRRARVSRQLLRLSRDAAPRQAGAAC